MSDEPVVVRMPKLADTLVEGTLGHWLKRVGEPVTQGEALASIETDKVTTELTAPAAGTVLDLLVAEGQVVPIETPIARIARIGSPATVDAPPAVDAPAASPSQTQPPRPTPVASRLLEEHGLRLEDVNASARRLTKHDVLRHLETRNAGRPLSSMRRAIADHMVKARQTIPHGQTFMAADVTELWRWREATRAAFEATHGVRLTLTVCFLHALARAFAETEHVSVDLGVAVAVPNGLVVPVIRAVDTLPLGETARALHEAAERARSGTLTAADMQGARMTLTNVGSFGNLVASPIVPVGQIGILGPGLVERRPLPAPDGIRLGYHCLVTLMFDRREMDDFAAD
ncbi:MAG: 2-oxo acid dehydrogenase subunit E2, partial [Chloroflexi bacterium]|nr:2-oxo acid dehydrogenase subunit E2 [Chloroflexota bacterium]